MAFEIRRVVTGHDPQGRAVVRSDGLPAHTIDAPSGFGVSDVLWLERAPESVDDGGEAPDGPVVLEPPVGGLSVRIIRIPAPAPGAPLDEHWLRVDGDEPTRPGMHATDTLDFVVVLDGEIVLGLDDGEHELHVGDVVVQRGNAHRWRVTGDRPCTYAVFMLRPDPAAPVPTATLAEARRTPTDDVGPRRLVAGADADGRSYAVADGAAPCRFVPTGPGGVALVDLWQTGGGLRDPQQGGDPQGPWALEPLAGGVAFRAVEMPAGHDPGDAGWHATDTIDVDLVVSGRLELALPDTEPVVLGPGDSVVQRGTNHRWRPVGDEPVRYVAVMLAVAPPAPRRARAT